ncbi:Aerotolerance protein BatB / Aerotolerance protein BatC [hydrothermal vent metagenome]|uniref:Aerotolerance protein BatB / Aerotolerance protein BatC n=1 Tax=hydrothermal vent metagenome TaxID=652676 RepID=A0A3B1AFD6_9ZZZZ
MSDFILLRPWWLLALIPLLLLAWLIWHKQNSQHSWKQVCDAKLLKYLIVGTETKKSNLTVILLVFYGFITIISLAGPAWDKLPQPVFRQNSSLIILLDLSLSMQAQDIKPSRLVRTRLKLLDALTMRREGQTALIVYAGDAFMVSPLTDDTDTIAQLVPSLIPAMMPGQGSRIDLAIAKALTLFKQGGITEGEILLLTDEVPEVYAATVTKLLNTVNFNLSILSVGTEQGAPINLRQGGFLKDSSGSIVIAKTNNKLLRQLAIRNNGQFSEITVDDSDINKLLLQNKFENNLGEKSDSKHDAAIWREQGPWLIILLLPLVLFSFRKGFIFIFVLMLLPVSEPSYALSWESLWSNKDQQAKQLLNEGKNVESAQLFQDSDWQAAANYKAGQYEKTLELLAGKTDIESTYNRANALAKLQRYEEALKNYDEVIKENPKHEDSLYNKKLVEDELKKQQQDKNKQDDKSKKEQDDKDSEQNKEQGDKSGDQQNQDKNKKNQQNKKSEQQSDKQDSKQQEAEKQQKNKESEQNKETASQEKNENKDKKNDNDKKQQQAKLNEQSQAQNKEQQQAVEQWLRKIPDDPAGLMRRKFKYQYQQRQNQNNTKGPAW